MCLSVEYSKTMTNQINSTEDVEVGDVISKGMQEFEVVDIQEEPDGFGPPFRATVVAQKELGDYGSKGDEKEFGKGRILSGFEVVEE